MAHGGIAILAIVFALAFALFGVADALAEVAVSVLLQAAVDEEGRGDLSFTIADTTISYYAVLRGVFALIVVVAALYGAWRLGRSAVRTCPECRSEVPSEASICRYCTTELPGSS
jgi:hypothetical protein